MPESWYSTFYYSYMLLVDTSVRTDGPLEWMRCVV